MSQSSNEEVKFTRYNIFKKETTFTKARRELIENPTTDEEIRAFAAHFTALNERRNECALHLWYEGGKLVGLYEAYPNSCSTRKEVEKSGERVYEYIFKIRPTTPPPINEFIVGKTLNNNIVEQIVRAVYISDWKGFKPKQKYLKADCEFYDVVWANFYVRFEDIQYITNSTIFKRFDKFFRENHPLIYRRIHNLPTPPEPTEQNLVQQEQPFTSNMKTSFLDANLAMATPSTSSSNAQQTEQIQQQVISKDNLLNSEIPIVKDPDVPMEQKQILNNTVENNDNQLAKVNKDSPADQKVSKMVVLKAKDKVKQEVASFPALAITVLHYREKPEDQITFLVILANYIPKASTNYKIETRVLSFEQIDDQSGVFTRKKFDETIKHFDLDKKYLVIITRDHLGAAFSGGPHKWLQCHEEFWDSLSRKEDLPGGKSVLKARLESLLSNFESEKSETNPAPDGVCLNSTNLINQFKEFEDNNLEFLKDMKKFTKKINDFTDPMEDVFPLSDLLVIWIIFKDDFNKLQKPWSPKLVKDCSDILKKLDQIHLTACFLCPFHFKNWEDSSFSDDDVYSDAHKERIIKELEKFGKLFADLTKIGFDTQANVAGNDSSLPPPLKRQKRLQEDIKRHSKENTINVPQKKLGPKEYITQEMTNYASYVINFTSAFDLDSRPFKFWTGRFASNPFLKEAAFFYLSLPATTISSGLLVRKAFAIARNAEDLEISDEEYVVEIINESLWDKDVGSLKANNETDESVGEDVINGNQSDNDNDEDTEEDDSGLNNEDSESGSTKSKSTS